MEDIKEGEGIREVKTPEGFRAEDNVGAKIEAEVATEFEGSKAKVKMSSDLGSGHHHHRHQDSFDNDDDYSSSDESDEEEEAEMEEDEEEEDESEEDEVESDDEEEEEIEMEVGKTQEEIEAELFEMQTILINQYITAKAQLKYERKRKAYFQDRIYRTSVRKGIIVESELVDESALAKTKKKRHCRRPEGAEIPNPRQGPPTDDEGAGPPRESILEDGQQEGEVEVKRKRKRRHHHKTKEDELNPTGRRGFIGEKFANEAKYQKLLRKIMKLQRSKAYYLVQHQELLRVHADKCTEWSELHVSYMNKLLDEIRFHSEFAVDSNTGKRMAKHETEEYCTEVSKIHHKFCDTMLKMYKSRRGLEFTLKRLKESEIQEGEEIEILEFEQLKDENSTLKDKLGDRMKDVENIQSKISYAIQILAHIRSKMSNMTENIGDGEEELIRINQEVYAAKAKTEEVMKELVQKRREERALVIDSGLLDNPILLRDYEETTERVNDMKEAKKTLERKMMDGNRELEDMQDRTAELKNHYPTLFSNTGSAAAAVQRKICANGLPYICKPSPTT